MNSVGKFAKNPANMDTSVSLFIPNFPLFQAQECVLLFSRLLIFCIIMFSEPTPVPVRLLLATLFLDESRDPILR